MIVRDPSPCTLWDLYLGDGQNPAIATELMAGLTKPPTHFVVPTYLIAERRTVAAQGAAVRQAYYGKLGVLQPRDPPSGPTAEQYEAQLLVTRRADEGNNTSIYLPKGVYETNSTFNLEGYKKARSEPDFTGNAASYLEQWQSSKPRVYLVMPDRIASMNMLAETEHCNDFLWAYQLTLHALDLALVQIAAAPLLPFASAQLARAARIAELHNALPTGLRGVEQSIDLCGQKYLALCEKSFIRDSSEWHSFGLDYLGPGVQAASIHYLTGEQREEEGRIYLQYTQGKAQVGVHPSEEIIRF